MHEMMVFHFIPNSCDCLFFPPVEPTVRLRWAEAAEGKHPGMLICSAYNFYPKHIKLTWLRDGKEAKAEVTSTEELPNGNWLYQIHSYLEITPKLGESISCMVEHSSLTKPKFYDWGKWVKGWKLILGPHSAFWYCNYTKCIKFTVYKSDTVINVLFSANNWGSEK